MTVPAPTAAIPPLVFTVAITGHQDIAHDLHDDLQSQIAGLLEQARAQLLAAGQATKIDRERTVTCRFVSALAPGADQIGAHAAQDKAPHWALHAVLPFMRPVYAALARETLTERGVDAERIDAAIAAISDLSDEADRVLELADWQPVGQTLQEENWRSRRYATIGQLLVRRADLLIALWDGNPARGAGGTADVVSEARRSGVPVIWIDPKSPNAVRSLVPDPASNHLPASDLVVPLGKDSAATGGHPVHYKSVVAGADDAIAAGIAQVLLGNHEGRATCVRQYLDEPPAQHWVADGKTGVPEPGDGYSAYARMLYWFLNLWPRKTVRLSPEQEAQGQPPGPLRKYPFAMARRDGKGRRRKVLLYPFGFGVKHDQPGTTNAAPLLTHAARADALATRLSNQYRSAYVWIFLLAPAAVTWAVISALIMGHFPEFKPLLVVIELATVSAAAAIYLRTRANDPVARSKVRSRWMRWVNVIRRFFPESQDTHQRWLDARLIAESQRSGQLLAWIGFSGRRPLEPDDAGHEHAHEDEAHDAHGATPGHAAPRTVWAPHYANAIAALPELPLTELQLDSQSARPHTAITPARVAALAQAAGKVIADQLGYHDINHQRLEALNHRLDMLSLRSIQWAAGISLAYLALWAVNIPVPDWAPWPGLVEKYSPVYHAYKGFSYLAAFGGAVLPAVAAAAAGIRFQGDFERFALRSKDTAARLKPLAERATRLATRAQACGETPCSNDPPLFESLLALLLETQSVLDEDLADWRFAYAARPITLG